MQEQQADELMSKYIKRYESKTGRSRQLFMHASSLLPSGTSHNIRYFEPYPFFARMASGKYIYDVDGNAYTDYWMGHWSLILGHAPKVVVDALRERVVEGTIFGTVNEHALRLAEMIRKLMPRAEMLRFASTGSEATMYAVRLARAYTGKRVVAKIEGGWHGFNTDLMHSVNYPFEEPEGRGMLEEEMRHVIALPFNDIDSSIKALNMVRDDLACIIVEPLLGGAGCIPADKDYLHALEEYARKSNALFILDEIVTGFRLSLHGAQHIYSLEPDIFTLGKIVGGGLPIGVVCGLKEVMNLADVRGKGKWDRVSIGGGTYSENPLSMSAGTAMLEYLARHSEVYERLEMLGDEARRGIDKVMSEHGIRVKSTGMGSLFLTHFLKDGAVEDVKSARDAALCDLRMQRLYHFALLSMYDIFFLPNKLGAISIEHDSIDIRRLVDSSERIASDMASISVDRC
ncbi:MAG: aspartate aminotransferase family protein [Candidatus Nitrosocaldus sp.]